MASIQLIRTDANHPDFKLLVKQLDAYLAIKDGDEHSFYDQYNQIDHIKYVVVAYDHETPIGCGAIKLLAPQVMEIKRMFVPITGRSKGIATKVLGELENWATELSCDKCVLETGKRQVEAIGLYQKNGYVRISNYGQYAEMDNSLCFEKSLNK